MADDIRNHSIVCIEQNVRVKKENSTESMPSDSPEPELGCAGSAKERMLQILPLAVCGSVCVLQSSFCTFITEWKDGAIRCREIFQSEAAFKAVADKLVDVAICYNFDGWLINIENPIQPQHMPQLIDFVKYLKESMHREKPGAKVIWYDSVIQDGSLKWQDMLNPLNSMFFDGSDGIFLNYTWTEQKLESTVTNSASRRQDVFVGVDVFGRNCYGGGGWNTWKWLLSVFDLLLLFKSLNAHSGYGSYQNKTLSSAIFAPGWVYECLPKKTSLKTKTDIDYVSVGMVRIQFKSSRHRLCISWHGDNPFNLPDTDYVSVGRFWETQLGSYLHYHGVTSLPFLSNFCRGYGKIGFKFGQPAMLKQWCNLSAQQIQPTFSNEQFADTKQKLLHTIDDGYNGGGCIQLQGRLKTKDNTQLFKIFSTDMEVKHPLLISMTTKSSASTGGCLILQLSNGNKIVLWPEIDEKTAMDQAVMSVGVHQSALLSSTNLPKDMQGDDITAVYGALVGSDCKALLDVTCGMDTSTLNPNGWNQQ
ncbi:putative cytosolic endo-beta-N-acetylglucosaminidase isoform X1 [Apostichopus japonicus]|uniref:Putative cytosolic endo-beta-N-acetylglucosaminidase isoform X1 n=1 Tax=Stichopus japonicus TaxID=307972 RepID=A0A2G8JF86_STIJA|nr:putative cytosolic endo-beta-N-acetylglucosaminidase isoform X1 [Apostichopus japonicus]